MPKKSENIILKFPPIRVIDSEMIYSNHCYSNSSFRSPILHKETKLIAQGLRAAEGFLLPEMLSQQAVNGKE